MQRTIHGARGEIDLVMGRAETCAGRKVNRIIELETAISLLKLKAGTLYRFQRSFFAAASRASIALRFYSGRGLEPRGFNP